MGGRKAEEKIEGRVDGAKSSPDIFLRRKNFKFRPETIGRAMMNMSTHDKSDLSNKFYLIRA